MKREFLKNFKVGEQELPKEVIDAILDENGKDMETVKAKYVDYDDLKARLEEAGKTIKGLEDLDVEGIKKAAEEWEAKAKKAEEDGTARVAEMEFNGLLSAAITGAKGRNAKAVMALLDAETLRASKNREADIKAALDGIKRENGYLFEDATTPPPYAGGTGTHAVLDGMDKEAFAKLGYRERLELKRSSPETYEKMKE